MSDLLLENQNARKLIKTLGLPLPMPQDLARARQIAMYLSREMTGASLNQIGRAFGDKDHSTVSHACRKIASLMQSDPRFRGAVLDIQDKIRARK